MNLSYILETIEEYHLEDTFKYVILNNRSNLLPYHNLNHILSVMCNCRELAETECVSFEGTRQLLIAALFHDFNHTGDPNNLDDVNISKAVAGFNTYISEIDNTFCKLHQKQIINLIEITKYPYLEDDPENLSIKQQIIRDADLMQGLNPDAITQCLLGLSEENHSTILNTLEGMISFNQDLEFNTKTAQDIYSGDLSRYINNLETLDNILDPPTK